MSQPVFTFVLSLKTMKLLINCIQNGDLFKVYINPVVFINLKYMPKKVYLFHRIDFKSCAIIKKAILFQLVATDTYLKQLQRCSVKST